jgi:heme-degrading monooxygenase HmoA
MIARTFRATATLANAPKYFAFFRDVLTPELHKIPGHSGALVLSRAPDDHSVEITVLTFWESETAIHAFAGDSLYKAVVEPEARDLLSAFDDRVTHCVVEVDTMENRRSVS